MLTTSLHGSNPWLAYKLTMGDLYIDFCLCILCPMLTWAPWVALGLKIRGRRWPLKQPEIKKNWGSKCRLWGSLPAQEFPTVQKEGVMNDPKSCQKSKIGGLFFWFFLFFFCFLFFHVYCPVLLIITIQYIKGIIKGTSGLCVHFKKNVDGQGTQAIIKNLNLKKLKRFWNQNFIEVNDYTV